MLTGVSDRRYPLGMLRGGTAPLNKVRMKWKRLGTCLNSLSHPVGDIS